MADIFAMVDTWNNGATTFAAIKMNVTDTASAAGSLLMDLQIGGVSKFKVTKGGGATLSAPLLIADGTAGTPAFAFASRTDVGFWLDTAATSEMCFGRTGSFGGRLNSGGIVITSSGAVAFTITDTQGSAADTLLWRDGPGIIAQRNSTNAQAFRLSNSHTDASNYERGGFDWKATANTMRIRSEAAGTGTVRIIAIDGFSKAGAAVAGDIPSGSWAMVRDTVGATTKLIYNNAGTLMSVALA